MAEISIRRVVKRYGDGAPAVNDVSLDVADGEMVILVGPPLPAAVSDEDIAAKLTPMLPVMKLSDAAKAAAEDLGIAKARVYDIGLALKRQAEG